VCLKALKESKLASNVAESAYTIKGFSNWKDATSQKGFLGHERCNSHKEAVERVLTLPAQTEDVGEALSAAHAEEKASNRRNLLKILDNINFLARQALPLRGGGDEENSNFMQLYHLRSIDNPDMKNWLERRADRYTSATVQNEILQTMALQVLQDVSSSLQKSEFFSVLADETADSSNKEQLVVCVRWVDDNFEAHDEFLGLQQLEDGSAQSIVQGIKTAIEKMGLQINKLRGQCYDGCSTMAGAKTGVATRIKEDEPRALYTHCYGHATNLACSESIRQVKVVKDAHDTLHEITKLVRNSPKRDTHLEKMKADMSCDEEGKHAPRILSFCPTRWTVRGKTLDSVLKNYANLQKLWEWSLDNCSDTDMKARIRGVSKHMEEFDFYFGIALGETLLRHSDNLSATLQKEDMSAAQAQKIAHMTMETLLSLRDDASFSLFYQKTVKCSEEVGVKEPVLPRQRRAPQRFEVGDGDTSHHFPTCVQDHYRMIYFEAIDTLATCLKDRFTQKDFEIYAKLEHILVKGAKAECVDKELEECGSFYGTDFDVNVLKTQLLTLSVQVKADYSDIDHLLLSDMIRHFRALSKPQVSLLSQVARLLKLIIVMPATNAVSERSFSAMRRLKTYLRTSMGEERLNNLMLLHVHKSRTDSLDMLGLANRFANTPHRQAIVGTFSAIDRTNTTVVTKTRGTQTQATGKK
jgi:hypothetical protein